MDQIQEQLNTLMLPILALVGLAFAVSIDPYVKKQTRRIMILIDAAVMTLILANCLANLLAARWNPSFVMLRTAISVYGYIVRPTIILLFIYIVWDSPKRRLFWILIALNAAVFLTAFFHHRRRDLASRSTGLFRSLGQFHTACSHDDHPSDSVQERQRN